MFSPLEARYERSFTYPGGNLPHLGMSAHSFAPRPPEPSRARSQTRSEVGPAADVDLLAGNPAGLLGGKEEDDVGDVLGPANAIEGRVGGGLGVDLRTAVQPGVQLGVDQPGTDRIDRDPPRGQLF